MRPYSFSNLEDSKEYLEAEMKREIRDNFYYLGECYFAEYCNRVDEAPEELRTLLVEIKRLHDRLGIEPQSKTEVIERIKSEMSLGMAPGMTKVEVQPVAKAENNDDLVAVESNETMRKCPSCGEMIQSNAMFCASCGFKIPEEENASVEEPVTEESESVEVYKEKVEIKPESAEEHVNREIRKCPSCGALVESSCMFCTICGFKMPAEEMKEETVADITPVEEPTVVSEPDPEVIEEPTIEAMAEKSESAREDVNEGIRKCPSCGAYVASSVKFCTTCGLKMPTEDVKEEPKAVEKHQEKVEREVRKEPEEVENTSVPEVKKEEKRVPLFCVQCGNKLRPGSRFCTKCGRKII